MAYKKEPRKPGTKSQVYRDRLMKEKPTHTIGGTEVKIIENGWRIETNTGRAWNRTGRSIYNPCDYPRLFGWELAKPRHYCVSCTRKIIEERMRQVILPFTNNKVWVCDVCFSRQSHRAVEVR